MVSTNYFDTAYQARINYRGSSSKESFKRDAKNRFLTYLARTPSREEIIYNYETFDVSIQDTRVSELSERTEKIVLAPIEIGFDCGSVFYWQDKPWIILTNETLPTKPHFKGKIRECNQILRWSLNEMIYQSVAHIVSNRSVGLAESTSHGIETSTPNLVLTAIIPKNENTSKIKREQRFLIEGFAWRVSSIDDISTEGLRLIQMKEDLVDYSTDDLESGISLKQPLSSMGILGGDDND